MKSIPFLKQWKAEVRKILSTSMANDLGFKVDWKVGRPSHITIYFRYYDHPNPSLQPANPLPDSYLAYLNNASRRDLSAVLSGRNPFCSALRLEKTQIPTSCTYFEIKNEDRDFESKLSKFAASFLQTQKVSEQIHDDLQQLSPLRFSGCIGIASQENILKIDLSGQPLGKILKFLRHKHVPEKRLAELLDSAKQLHQIKTNYFGLKYGATGRLGWKLYFVQPNKSTL